ncbi:MAG: hypothetical protein WC782_16565 [Methylococcaceae bacterium]|jgi:hypothetical protein
MNTNVIFVKSIKGLDISEFFTKIYASPDITRDFMVTRLNNTAISDVLRKQIIEDGISTLFHYSITCDAVLHPGIHVDEIETVILGFVQKLNAAKNLLIIDPYFYSNEPATLSLFEKMMTKIYNSLEKITFMTNGTKAKCQSDMHDILKKLKPAIQIEDVVTNQFHDRFWIDLDNLQGIVMGTSLNGITKKICLVDHIADADVRQIVDLAKPLLST